MQKQELKRKYQVAGAIFFLLLLVTILCGGIAIRNSKASAATKTQTVEYSSVKVLQRAADADKLYYDIPLSEELQDYIFSVAKEYGVPAGVIIAVIDQESDFDQYAVGACGEQGYMQIHPCNFDTLREELGVTDLFDAEQNIRSGAYLLSAFFDRYDTGQALMCYNCGEYGASSLWEQGVYSTEYSESVIRTISTLEYKEAEK